MQVSYNWLKELVPFDATPAELAHKMTMAGLEVAGIRYLGQGLEGVIVGEIIASEPHPDADHLSVCRVKAGAAEHEVVCGAPNARAGLKSAFVPVGVTLPVGQTVTEATIRGVRSQGMLCSEKELGLSTDHTGIIELPPTVQSGQPIIAALELDDYALEFDLTTNRSDALSHVGIAREAATIFNQPLKLPPTDITETDVDVMQLARVTIENTDGCPRYAARVIRNVTIGPSPAWLQRKLRAAGQRPINNVVDITNYVLMELGHPLHAFDYDLLAGHHIIVRLAEAGEPFTTLDHTEHELTPHVLMIADEQQSVAVGGVMGGLNSEVSDQTRNILLESAYFNPATIRSGSRVLNTRTESSQRFEKGADPENVIRAINRAAQLMAEIAGGQVARGIIDVYPKPIARQKTTLRPNQVERILGIAVPEDEIERILVSLGFEVKRATPEQWDVTIPTFRQDVQREVDLIEEIARHFGYANIPERLQAASDSQAHTTRTERLFARIRHLLAGMGYTEFLTTSLVDESMLNRLPQFGVKPDDPALVRIKNPLTAEHNALRPTLLSTVLPRIQKNINQKTVDLKIFEIGRVFQQNQQNKTYQETTILGLFACGDLFSKSWEYPEKAITFFDLKGLIEDVFEHLKISGYEFRAAKRPWLHPVRAAEILIGGNVVGTIGELVGDLRKTFDVTVPAYWAEMELDKIMDAAHLVPAFEKIPRYPAVERDLALVIEDRMAVQPILQRVRDVADTYLENVHVFDIYRGEPLTDDQKSVAISLTFRAPDRTLVDDEVDVIIERILQTVQNEFNATLRS